MNPILCRMKKRSPSSGQNGQLVHWWLLFHSAPRVRTGSIRRIELGFEEIGWEIAQCRGLVPFGEQRQGSNSARDTAVRLSLCLYDSAFASCFSIETKKTQKKKKKKKRLVCCCCVCCRDLIACGGRTHSCGLQLTGDFIGLVLDPEAEPTRRDDLLWDKEVCLFCVPLLPLLLHCVENVLQELQTRGL